MTYVVECIICSQPWEVPSMMVAVPGQSWLKVPDHAMLNPQTSEPTSIPCPGNQRSGIGVGRRDEWERNWSMRKIDRPRPDILDGNPVSIITI